MHILSQHPFGSDTFCSFFFLSMSDHSRSPSVAKTVIDSDTEVSDEYGFLARAADEELNMNRERSRSPVRVLIPVRPTVPSSSSSSNFRFSSALASSTVFARQAGTMSDNPAVMALRAMTRLEMPHVAQKQDLKIKWPSYNWDRLFEYSFFEIKDEHQDVERAARRYNRYKFGITICPIHRWIELGLERSFEKMFVFVCANEQESSELEKAYIQKWSHADIRCANNTKGGEGASPSIPHFLCCSKILMGPTHKRLVHVNR